jgi:hypothetical protein
MNALYYWRPVLRIASRIFLILALLAGWQAALQHPIEHVDGLGEFVHVHSGHSHEDGSESGPLCDALAALTACAPDAMPLLVASQQLEHSPPSLRADAPRVAEAPPFLSQGPPASV